MFNLAGINGKYSYGYNGQLERVSGFDNPHGQLGINKAGKKLDEPRACRRDTSTLGSDPRAVAQLSRPQHRWVIIRLGQRPSLRSRSAPDARGRPRFVVPTRRRVVRAPVVLKCHGRRAGIAAPRRTIRGLHRPKLRRERTFLMLISCPAGIRVRASHTRHTRARLRRSHRFAFHASRRKQPACLSFPPRLRRPAPSLTADQTPRTALRRPSTWLTKARFPPSCAITAPAWSRCVNVPRSGHTPEACVVSVRDREEGTRPSDRADPYASRTATRRASARRRPRRTARSNASSPPAAVGR